MDVRIPKFFRIRSPSLSVACKRAEHTKRDAPIPGFLIFSGPLQMHIKTRWKQKEVQMSNDFLLYKGPIQLHMKRRSSQKETHISQGL